MAGQHHQRRRIALAIRRYHEVSYQGHGRTRYFSVAVVTIAIAVLVPGMWWALAAGLLGLACMLDRQSELWVTKQLDTLDQLSEQEAERLLRRVVHRAALIVAVYALPNMALAFAAQPGPLIGLIFCMTAAALIATQHGLTRSMVLYTFPAVALAMVMNGVAMAPAGSVVGVVFLMMVAIVSIVVNTQAGADAFDELIRARLAAEDSAATLERRVAERTADLVEVTRVAEAANKAKSAFLANMSHELRTPLNAVIGYSEIICEDFAAGQTEDCPAHAAKIRASAMHLLGLIADILDISKVEADRLIITPADIDVAALARETLEIVAPMAGANRTAVDLVVEPGVSAMHADPLRVRQCLMNLLSNAAKFTSEGRIVVHVRRCDFEGVDAISFAVRDTGVGISAENLTRLFQPFIQADPSTTRLYGGAGLGLAITRQLARLMGGDVHAESELGCGSAFTLIVPVAPAVIESAERAAA